MTNFEEMLHSMAHATEGRANNTTPPPQQTQQTRESQQAQSSQAILVSDEDNLNFSLFLQV